MQEKITFEIDADDRLIAASKSWDPFAVANGAPELTVSNVRGRNLYEFISDPETSELQRMIYKQARSFCSQLEFNIRCDSPTHLRLLRLVVSSEDRKTVRTESSLLRYESQNSGALFARNVERHGELLRVCSWCLRSRVGPKWLEPVETAQTLGLFEVRPVPQLTHGICEDCFEKASSLLV